MTWVVLDTAQQAIVDEIEKQTDRGAGLVAAAFLETRLRNVILTRLRPQPNADIRGRVLSRDGALSTFARKIDMGYMLQLYPFSILEMLNIVRDIRNDFAHCEKPIDFSLISIKDRSENLEKMVFSNEDDFMAYSTALLDLIRPVNPTWIEAMGFYKPKSGSW